MSEYPDKIVVFLRKTQVLRQSLFPTWTNTMLLSDVLNRNTACQKPQGTMSANNHSHDRPTASRAASGQVRSMTTVTPTASQPMTFLFPPRSEAQNPVTTRAPAITTKSTVASKTYKGTMLGAMYYVPKAVLTGTQIATMRTDLTVVYEKKFGGGGGGARANKPSSKRRKVGGDNDDNAKDDDAKEAKGAATETEFPAYIESGDGFLVPRFYGLERFGLPEKYTTTVGVPMQDGLVCNLQLQEARRQPEAVEHVRRAFQQPGNGGFLSLPCGYGKTDCALYIAVHVIRELDAQKKSRRTVVVVPDGGLLEQWKTRIETRIPGVKVGVLRQNQMEIEGSDIVVAMVHSLSKRDSYVGLDTFGLMILDEAHHMSAPMFSRALRRIPAKYILALSATPERANDTESKLLHWYMGPIVFKPPRPPNRNVHVSMLWYSTTPGKDISTKAKVPLTALMLERMVKDEHRTKILVDQILQYYADPARGILVISKRIQQLADLKEMLLRKGVPRTDLGLINGKVSLKEREVQKNRRIVLAIEKLGREGLDAPHLNTLIIALPLTKIEQPTGRIQRTLEEHLDRLDNDQPYVPPHVIYLVDPYGLYQGIANKNLKEFKSFGYTVGHTDLAGYKFKHFANK